MPEYGKKIVIVGLILIFAYIMQSWRTRLFDYQCGKCGEKFSMPTWKAVLSVHNMGSKLVKCPKCGKWCWANPVPKE